MNNFLFDISLSSNEISPEKQAYLNSITQHIKTQLIDIDSMNCHFYRVSKNNLSEAKVSSASIDFYDKNDNLYAINLIICNHFEWPQEYELANGQTGVDIYLKDAVDAINILFYFTQQFALQYLPTSKIDGFNSDFRFIRVKSNS
ncbi:Uncharacterised protein [Oligella urethralis]|uniref:hypothetical protein n=1 Tax=Oligella urethralis TaxID=90245 RepID=UPI000E010C54|nr:hypothetical protein [Oligella urethralis]SUA61581.1 Uncharacterised protein [Oligella urethralis]